MAAKRVSSDHARGYRDGYHGLDDRRESESDEYRQGFANGLVEREEAHERMNQTCKRFARLASV